MRTWVIALLVLSLDAPASPLDGSWSVRYRGEKGGEREASLALRGGTGTWYIHMKNSTDRKNPCIGQDWSAQVEAVEGGAWRLQVDGKRVADFCGRLETVVSPRPDGSWEGELHGAPLRLERKP